jgi:hypothetical protein
MVKADRNRLRIEVMISKLMIINQLLEIHKIKILIKK